MTTPEKDAGRYSAFDNLVTCPFCGEQDFDLIGLKNHLLCYCDAFKECPKP